MRLRRPLQAPATACLVVVTVLLTVAPAGAASNPAGPQEQPSRGLRYGGLQPGRAGGPCTGTFEIRLSRSRGGPARCTHGPDAAPGTVDVRMPREPETAASAALRPETALAAAGTACSGDGTTGPRVQLVYANVAGNADRYAAYADSFQVWAAAMDSVYNQSAGETGGGRRIRFVHDASCAPTVSRTTISSAGAADFQTTIDEVYAAGFNRNDRKYLIWVDANVYCGIGEVFHDDHAAQTNYNNVYGMFARVDNGCWGVLGQSIEAHELMHNLGGVQTSAPHATTFNHCTDDYDRMCYPDGSGATMSVVCPAAHENLFDCNHDDYFNTAPPAGSYLATHWNAANSAWLTSGAAPTVPGPPSAVTAVAGEGLATLTWAPPADGGLQLTGYVVTPSAGGVAGPAQTFSSSATTQTVTGLTNGASYTFRVAARNGLGTGPQSTPTAPVVPNLGSGFHPVTPARLLDTRAGNGAPLAPVAAGTAVDLQVAGRGPVPATGVSAVVLNVTVTNPTAPGYVTAWPAGDALPLASNLNFVAGQTVPNLVMVKVGGGGKVSLYVAGSAADLVADVAGWYGPAGDTSGSRYNPLTPARILDTRSGNGSAVTQLLSGGTLDLQVTGRGGVPASGVSAVVLNVTVTGPLGAGFLTAWPTAEAMPLASNLNFASGQTVPNLVVVKLGAGGKVSLYDGGGAADVIADVAGWFGPGGESTGARYHPVTPARLLDTRIGVGGAGAIGSRTTLDLQAAGAGGVPAVGVTAVVLNVTAVSPAAPGFVTVWPSGDPRPLASNLNVAAGQTVPNLVVAKLGAGGKVSIYNAAGSTNLVADVAGWYGAG